MNDLDHTSPSSGYSPNDQLGVIAMGGVTLGIGYLGMGLPQHYYQPLFAALTLVVLYRHKRLLPGTGAKRWILVLINFSIFCLLYKLMIGGGVSHPFDWLKVPSFSTGTSLPEVPWHEKIIPDFKVEMRPIPEISDWSIDITKIQTLLLLSTLAGAVFRFQPFASLTAVILVLVSIPTFAAFDWDWVILFLIGSGVNFYLQSPIKAASGPDS